MTTTFLQTRAAGLAGLVLVFLSNCAPSEVAPPPRDGAATDTVADAPRDLPGGDGDAVADNTPADVLRDSPCSDGGTCSGGQRCDPARLRCVDCLAADHCGGATPVCASGRCVAATPCTSSRMCPGQVCDLNAMRCVDCVTDAECDPGQRCVANVCGAPIACRSSRDCSAGGLVCNVAQMRCVECLEDRDCAMGSACTTGNVCRVSACTASARRCVSATRLAVCDARGAAETETDCASGEVCTGGECRRLLCAPGAASCESTSARRTCNADGMAYTVAACAAGETCIAGECRRPGCTAWRGDMHLDDRAPRVQRGRDDLLHDDLPIRADLLWRCVRRGARVPRRADALRSGLRRPPARRSELRPLRQRLPRGRRVRRRDMRGRDGADDHRASGSRAGHVARRACTGDRRPR
jgi:hypothetical protein